MRRVLAWFAVIVTGLLLQSTLFAPPNGFTLADYVAARTVGGRPVTGAVGIVPGRAIDGDALRAGIVVVVQWRPGASVEVLDRLLRVLAARRLQPVRLAELVASARRTAATA